MARVSYQIENNCCIRLEQGLLGFSKQIQLFYIRLEAKYSMAVLISLYS